MMIAYHEVLDIVYETELDDHGRFYLQQMVAGEYTLHMGVDGFHKNNALLKVAPGETTHLTVELLPLL